MNPSQMTFIEGFSPLAPAYDVVLCDIWGVLHNGVAAFPEASDALSRFRAGGGRVALITNAPRPGSAILPFIQRLGVSGDAYDDIVTSGDLTRERIAARAGQTVFHIGPERDAPIFEGLPVRFADADSADYVVCTGLFDDERETAENYRNVLARLRGRDRFMLCANPDLVVERGDRLIHCAGAVADLYVSLGGQVFYAGKPHGPIYEQALGKVDRRGAVPKQRVLAIGDSIRTDLTGAAGFGIDALFVTAGIHAEEFGGRHDPDLPAVERTLTAAGMRPRAVMRHLAW